MLMGTIKIPQRLPCQLCEFNEEGVSSIGSLRPSTDCSVNFKGFAQLPTGGGFGGLAIGGVVPTPYFLGAASRVALCGQRAR